MSTYWRERRADRAAEREEARKDRRERDRRRNRRRDRRRRIWAKRRASVAARASELPWLLIMGSPMVLSWTAMANYGAQVYGPVGLLLPLFSEAALLVFALASARAAKRGEPTALLRLGTAVFGAVAATLNYIHGAEDSVVHGVVMAVVSVGGVAVHQIIHARPPRPRRTRDQREADRLARLRQRRVSRLQRAALRAAVPVVGSDGTVSLVHKAGEVVVEPRWWRRTRLVPVPPPTPADRLAKEIETWLSAGAPERPRVQGGPAETLPGDDLRDQDRDEGPDALAVQPKALSATDEERIQRVMDAVAKGMDPTNENVRVLLRLRNATTKRLAQIVRTRLGGEGGAAVRV